MTTERMLQTIAVLKAYGSCDSDGTVALIKGGGPEMFADLLEFTLMVLQHDSESGGAVAYLDRMQAELVPLHLDEVSRA